MRRRDFIAAIGGSAVAWPLAAQAQQEKMRRVAALLPNDQSDTLQTALLAAFTTGLSDLGWREGRNLRMDIRRVGDDIERLGAYAKELVNLQPEVIFAFATPQIAALQRETRTIPIVFALASDPIGSGFVANMARPGGNITGFMAWEPTMAGKWLQMLTEIAPEVKRVGAMYNPDTAPYVPSYYLASFETAARSLSVEPLATPIHSDADIEAAVSSLTQGSRGGLVTMPDAFIQAHRRSIINVAALNNIPTIFAEGTSVREGGLLSYGPDFADVFRRAASYVDRILRGAKPADLPVQLPVKFESAVNLKTAKALGIKVPTATLLRANEVIE